MKSQKLVLIGAGGHCRSCIDVIESEGKYKIFGLLDQDSLKGTDVLGYKIIGNDEMIPELAAEGYNFLITVGQIKSSGIRKNLFDKLEGVQAKIATVKSPMAYVSKYAVIGKGSIIMHHAMVNANATIGKNNIINTAALVEHDVLTGNHCHLSTHAVVNGDCIVGDDVFIGSGAVISNRIKITGHTVIAAGAVIYKNITEAGIYTGQKDRMEK